MFPGAASQPARVRVNAQGVPTAEENRLAHSLQAQVTALMLNAQRYEMRAVVKLQQADWNAVEEALAASDHFASLAFEVINHYMQGKGASDPIERVATVPTRPPTREEWMAAETPDAVALQKPIDPDMPDVMANSEDGVVVNSEGQVLRDEGERGRVVHESDSGI